MRSDGPGAAASGTFVGFTLACMRVGLWVAIAASPALAQVSENEPNDSLQEANQFFGETTVVDAEITNTGGSGNLNPDFFIFSQLDPFALYTVTLTNNFLGLGVYSANGTLLDSEAFTTEQPELEVEADANGEVFVGVCGYDAPQTGNYDCDASASGFGTYDLTVPEPGAGLLAATAAGMLGVLRRRARHTAPRRR